MKTMQMFTILSPVFKKLIQHKNLCAVCSAKNYENKFYSTNRNMTELIEKFSSRCFGGYQKIYIHQSKLQNCDMQFAIYLPAESKDRKLPVIYFLVGLTMDHSTFIEKSGIQKIAARYGVIIVTPDSSPCNENVPVEKNKWNIGKKASYYIDTTEEPWCKNYKMYSYISKELTQIINENFPVLTDKQSIMGHSIGGHGAILAVFKEPTKFKSLSALCPVCDITQAPHSLEGLESYLGKRDGGKWEEWSAINLAKHYKGPPLHILIDQGTADEYLDGHLHTKEFVETCHQSAGISVTLNMREDYAHDYYFVTTFLEDHIKYHMQYLK